MADAPPQPDDPRPDVRQPTGSTRADGATRPAPRPGAGVTGRLLDWFGVDSDWERMPADPARAYRNDLWLGLAFVGLGVVAVELGRSMGQFAETDEPAWLLYVLAVVSAAPLAWRRRYPLLVLAVVYGTFLAIGLTVPMVTSLAPMQVVYFVALHTALAWALDRRSMLIVVGVALLTMFAWIIWQYTVGTGLEWLYDESAEAGRDTGYVSPLPAFFLYTLLVNVAYFGGAIASGQLMWHAARRREQLADQAVTIETQAAALTDQAIVAERVRIARELHDVVAHHVSVIGIQAAAARRVLDREPALAAEALVTIERESREGVAQMRNLVGTLRSVPDGGAPGAQGASDGASRAPEPGLADLPALTAADYDGLDTTFRQVEEPPGAAADVPAPMGLSLYRTAQEAMANVRKHSTARSATVTLRVVRDAAAQTDPQFTHGFAEIEVLDDGRPRHGTSGSGLGLLGIRERVATHRGAVEIGPRATGGYRVRVRLPLPAPAPAPKPASVARPAPTIGTAAGPAQVPASPGAPSEVTG